MLEVTVTGVVVVVVVVFFFVPTDDGSKRLTRRIAKFVNEKGDADATAEAVLIRFVMLAMLLMLLPLASFVLLLQLLLRRRRRRCVVVLVSADTLIPAAAAAAGVVVASDCTSPLHSSPSVLLSLLVHAFVNGILSDNGCS